MDRKFSNYSIIGLLLALAHCVTLTLAADDPASGKSEVRTIQKDIVYKSSSRGELGLDLHYPNAAAPQSGYPLVVFIHGGGWAKGDKKIGTQGGRYEAVRGLNAAGFAVASVNYRLCVPDSDIRIYDCIVDCVDAVRFLVKHASHYSLDAENLFSMGDSAGGHLAQMVLLASSSFQGDPALADTTFSMVAGVSWYGPCDFEKRELFLKPDGTGNLDRFRSRLLRGDESDAEVLAAFRQSSPVNYLKASSPPLLMIQGDQDPTIPVHHAYYMQARAESVGAPVQVLIVENTSHGWKQRGDGPRGHTLDQIVQRTVDFMSAHLK